MSQQFISDILSTTGENEIADITDQIPEVEKFIQSYKEEVKAEVDESTINFFPFTQENEKLKSRAMVLQKNMTALNTKIEDEVKAKISDSISELQKLSSSLVESNFYLYIINTFIEVDTKMKQASDLSKRKQFFEESALLSETDSLLKELKKEISNDVVLDILKPLQTELILAHEQLLFNISTTWAEKVHIDRQESENTVILNVDINSLSIIREILKASHKMNYLLLEQRFADKLMNDILKPLIVHKCTVVIDSEENLQLTVNIYRKETSQYTEVFENILSVINFLKEFLTCEVGDNIFVIAKIGALIKEEFTNTLIQNCLSTTIPASSEDLKTYANVITSVENFQTELQESNFLPDNCSSLIEYARNVNVLFANKFCQFYLEKARNIMRQDLHDTLVVEKSLIDLNEIKTSKSRKDQLIEEISYQFEANNSKVQIPQYKISKSAEELLHLVNEVLREVGLSQDICAVRLFYTARNIFEMYAAVVPLHHKKFLETLPQQNALFHNNCVYFSHQLLSLKNIYKDDIPPVLKEHSDIFLEQSLMLSKLGLSVLESFLSNQRSQIVYILRDSGLATLNENPKLQPNTEKFIRQCLRQLQLLENVWKDVLPAPIYNRVIGALLSGFLEEVISLISKVEDIASDTATELVSMFTVILDRAPLLFWEPKEINRHSKMWQKFKEFVLLLGANLKDINERWADGMGPLANEFSADQVKRFIRALFRNNDRRAALLARIK